MSDSILIDVISGETQDDLTARIREKGDRIIRRSQELLLHIVRERNGILSDFWNNSNGVGPLDLSKFYGPGKLASIVGEDVGLVEYLATRLQGAGATPERVMELLLGVPPEYRIVPVEGGLKVERAPVPEPTPEQPPEGPDEPVEGDDGVTPSPSGQRRS